VALTTYADDENRDGRRCRPGRAAYLTKDAGAEQIRRRGRRRGGRARPALDPAVQKAPDRRGRRGRPGAAAPDALPDGLTPREAEVLGLIAARPLQQRDRRPARGQRGDR